MTEQDKQALIKHFCKRDCGDAAENCEIMPCHEIELIQEFPTTEADSDTISRAKAIDGKICIRRSNGVEIYDDYVVPVEYLEQLPPAQPKTGKWALQSDDYHEYYECDQCGMAVGLDDVRNFCPNCGADMREVTE